MLQSTLGSAQRFKKRERTQNWAYEEKHFLLELCRKDMHIIENKRLDSALTSLKNRAWKIIHQQFAIAFGTDRNCNRLKEQWRRMKACTRAEMLDYQQRIQRYGQEVADRKKPSQFTFEIWEFMQEAKKVCKNELMDDVDYSKMKLSLEENLPQGVSIKECSDENDDESSSMWDKNSTNLCEVQIKEDSSIVDDDEGDDGGYDKCGGRPAKFPRLGALPSSSPYSVADSAAASAKFNELLASSFASRISELSNNNNNVVGAGAKGGVVGLGELDSYSRSFGAGSDANVSDVPVNMSQTDLSSTLEALNILKSRFHRLNELGQWKNAFHEVQNLSTNSHHHSEDHQHRQSPQRQQPQHQPQQQVHHHTRDLPHHGRDLQTASSPIPATVSASATTNSSSSSNGSAHVAAAAKLASEQQQQHRQSEHELRMEILKTDLETAKINKETAELNRQIALQKLNSLNS
uniref:Regulatory protein zeste n=1 Tax=Culex tarsalis TaxID=7177 RepID=A0A1Q3EV97_CULTA